MTAISHLLYVICFTVAYSSRIDNNNLTLAIAGLFTIDYCEQLEE